MATSQYMCRICLIRSAAGWVCLCDSSVRCDVRYCAEQGLGLISVGGTQTYPQGAKNDAEIWRRKKMLDHDDYLTTLEQGRNHEELTLGGAAKLNGNECMYLATCVIWLKCGVEYFMFYRWSGSLWWEPQYIWTTKSLEKPSFNIRQTELYSLQHDKNE